MVKTCCILHNFARQTAFSAKILYANVPSTVMAIEVMLQERIWTGGLRGRECLSVGESGRGLVYRGLECRRRLWKRAPLSIGAPLRRMEGGGVRSSETLRDS